MLGLKVAVLKVHLIQIEKLVFIWIPKKINENLNFSLTYIGTNYPDSKIDNYDELEINFSLFIILKYLISKV